MKKISLVIDVDVLYDELNNEVTVDCINSIAKTPTQSNILSIQRKLQISEIKYGILMIGNNEMGKSIPMNQDINVIYNGVSYKGHSHRGIAGRIDRLGNLVSKSFKVNEVVELRYDVDNKELYIIDVDQNEKLGDSDENK